MNHKLLKGSQLGTGMLVTVVKIQSESIEIQSGIIQSKEGIAYPGLNLYKCYNEQLDEEFTFTWWDYAVSEEVEGELITSVIFEGLPY